MYKVLREVVHIWANKALISRAGEGRAHRKSSCVAPRLLSVPRRLAGLSLFTAVPSAITLLSQGS